MWPRISCAMTLGRKAVLQLKRMQSCYVVVRYSHWKKFFGIRMERLPMELKAWLSWHHTTGGLQARKH
eukprot:6466056-Amphidinium_carterae.1